jgi:hypothetical protein
LGRLGLPKQPTAAYLLTIELGKPPDARIVDVWIGQYGLGLLPIRHRSLPIGGDRIKRQHYKQTPQRRNEHPILPKTGIPSEIWPIAQESGLNANGTDPKANSQGCHDNRAKLYPHPLQKVWTAVTCSNSYNFIGQPRTNQGFSFTL